MAQGASGRVRLGSAFSHSSSRRPATSPQLATPLLPMSGTASERPDSPDGGSTLIVEKKHHDNFTILYVEGLIKLGESAEFFSAALEGILKNENSNVIIDFTKIDYIDSTGIGELVGYMTKFSTQNRKLILVNPSDRVQKLMKLAKLDSVFKIYESETAAIGAERVARA
jgi:anti-anti-sigma factor